MKSGYVAGAWSSAPAERRVSGVQRQVLVEPRGAAFGQLVRETGEPQPQPQPQRVSPIRRKFRFLTFARRRKEFAEKSLRPELSQVDLETYGKVASSASCSSGSSASSNNFSASELFQSSSEFDQLHKSKQEATNRKTEPDSNRKPSGNCFSSRLKALLANIMKLSLALVVLLSAVYLWPMRETEIEPKLAPLKPRPKFQGPLQVNNLLDERTELLFKDQFHAPESMAWTGDRRAFYTGVEGGFILLVEPYEERWSIVGRLNSRRWPASDLSQNVQFVKQRQAHLSASNDLISSSSSFASTHLGQNVTFCARDLELYGERAEFEPRLVYLSRCSRPLGIRLAPDESYLYAIDPLSGLYKVHLPKRAGLGKVFKLLDFLADQQGPKSERRILFGDDIAVEFNEQNNKQDLIYLTDCSERWSLRYLFRILGENDDSGRILKFHTREKILYQLEGVTPVEMGDQDALDQRKLSFPNGIEFSADKRWLLISDLNNRRILKHDLSAGKTKHLLWVPGYPDNIRRGLDSPSGKPTYWAACGCAVPDGEFELNEYFNDHLRLRKLALKLLHFSGAILEYFGQVLNSVSLQDAGFSIKAAWFKRDPYCDHGLVFQFDEEGQVLQSLHAPNFQSYFKLLSEAHEVPIVEGAQGGDLNSTAISSHLYLGSVYYSYLGRAKLNY